MSNNESDDDNSNNDNIVDFNKVKEADRFAEEEQFREERIQQHKSIEEKFLPVLEKIREGKIRNLALCATWDSEDEEDPEDKSGIYITYPGTESSHDLIGKIEQLKMFAFDYMWSDSGDDD